MALGDDLEGRNGSWGEGRRLRTEETYVHMWLIHDDIMTVS